jgi:hypothetical protein
MRAQENDVGARSPHHEYVVEVGERIGRQQKGQDRRKAKDSRLAEERLDGSHDRVLLEGHRHRDRQREGGAHYLQRGQLNSRQQVVFSDGGFLLNYPRFGFCKVGCRGL